MRLAFLLLLIFVHPVWAQTVWRAATEYPATAMPGEGLTRFAQEVAIRTGGAVKIEPRFDAPDGLRSATIPAAVKDGRIEVGDAFAGALEGLNPLFQISSLPFLATSQDQAWQLYQAAKPRYAEAFAALGQRLLFTTPWPASGIWSRDKVARVEGLAIRTYDAMSTRTLQRAGAKAVLLSFADTMPKLRDGSVAAVLSSGDGGAGRKLWEFTPHFTAIGYAMPLSFVTVSDAAYQALPESQRAAINAAAGATEAAQWQALRTRTEKNYAVMRNNHVEIAEPGPELAASLAEAGRGETAAWLAGVPPAVASVLDAYRRR